MRSIGARLPVLIMVPLVFSACAGAPTSSSQGSSSAPRVDGQIVFEDVGKDFQYSQIWIENGDGSNVRKLVSDDFTDSGGSLSPDGERVVFYQGYPTDPSLIGRIMLVNVDGSGLHELETGNRVNGCDAGPEGDAWSPDGRRIAYARFCFDRSGNAVETGIWTINADGTDARQVTKHGPAKLLPNGTWAPHLEDHRASWSPDGKQLVFEQIDTSTTPERAAIFTIGVDGRGLHQVTAWTVDANDPVWSPDGSLIAFNAPAEPARDQNIYTIHPEGTGLAKLTANDEGGQATFHPSWSPDGTRILFSHSPSTDGWADFFVMNRDGGDLHILAATTLHENHAYWGRSPSP